MNVLITGTSRGLGSKLARHLLGLGHNVFGCSRGQQKIDHARYKHYVVDVNELGQIRSMIGDLRKKKIELDALMNNAAVSTMNHFLFSPSEDNKRIFDTNVNAVIDFSRESCKLLKKSDGEPSVIVNFSSVAVPWSLDGQLAYAASKSSVESITKVMSKELIDFGIRVNCIGLPPLRTALSRSVPKEKIDKLIERQVIKRQCNFDDVFGLVEFMISKRSAFITGETIYLGGIL